MDSTELAIIISCPTSESEIVVLLKMTPQNRKIYLKMLQKVTCTVTIFVEHDIIIAHRP